MTATNVHRSTHPRRLPGGDAAHCSAAARHERKLCSTPTARDGLLTVVPAEPDLLCNPKIFVPRLARNQLDSIEEFGADVCRFSWPHFDSERTSFDKTHFHSTSPTRPGRFLTIPLVRTFR